MSEVAMRSPMARELRKQDEWVTRPRRNEQAIMERDSNVPSLASNVHVPIRSHGQQFTLSRPLYQLATVNLLSVRWGQIRGVIQGSESLAAVPVLFVIDLILGQCARYFILRFKCGFSEQIPRLLEKYCFHGVDSSLRWLNDWPVGLKLNTPLSEFYSSTLGSIVRAWGRLLVPFLERQIGLAVRVIANSSCLGLSLALSIAVDLLGILTLHLRLCWIVTRTICLWQLDSLSGLWNLFRGKRWNVLRKRTDSYAYDVDQLFLGTLLFTVSIFLFPTTLIYASLFGVIDTYISAVCWSVQLPVGTFIGLPLEKTSGVAHPLLWPNK